MHAMDLQILLQLSCKNHKIEKVQLVLDSINTLLKIKLS